jgi:hypothetical protein
VLHGLVLHGKPPKKSSTQNSDTTRPHNTSGWEEVHSKEGAER